MEGRTHRFEITRFFKRFMHYADDYQYTFPVIPAYIIHLRAAIAAIRMFDYSLRETDCRSGSRVKSEPKRHRCSCHSYANCFRLMEIKRRLVLQVQREHPS